MSLIDFTYNELSNSDSKYTKIIADYRKNEATIFIILLNFQRKDEL